MKAFINPQWAEALGLTLFDSLWQGALVLIVSFVVLLFMKKASPAKRYAVVLVATLILPLLSITTFLGHLDNGAITSTFNSPLDFENTSVFSLEFNEASTPIEQVATSLTIMEKWKAWTSQNANLALVVWLMGAFLFTVRMLGGFYFLNRLKSGANLITDSVWLEKMNELCNSLKIKGKVLLKQSERVSSPLVMGVIKPVIIFPMGLIQALPTDEIEAILVHELAHIKRKDFLINIVINLLQVIYFFHPAFWWLKIQLDAEREFHCDDIALNQLGKKLTLIKALTNASEYQGHKFQPALAFAGKKNQLLSRVKRIVDHKPQMNWFSGFMSLGILVLSFALMSQNATQEDKPIMADLEEDNIESLMQNPVLQDTTKVNKAILELLNPNSKVTVKTDASGTVTMILNDKAEITGEEFEAYKTAFNQIHMFSEEHQSAKEKLETEAKRSAKTQTDQQIIRTQEVLREVEELIKASAQSKASVVEKAEVTQEEIIEWVERVKEEEAKLVEAQEEVRKIQGRTGNILVTQRNRVTTGQNDFTGNVSTLFKGTATTEIVDNQTAVSEEVKKLEESLQEKDTIRLTLKNVSKKITDDTNEPVELKFTRAKATNDSLIYEVDNKIVDEKDLMAIDPKAIVSVQVIRDQAKILKIYPQLKGENLALIRASTKNNNDLESNSLLVKDPFTASAITHDFTRIEFGDALSYDLQLKFVSDRLAERNIIIDLDGELKPEMTFDDLNNLGDKKVQTVEIIKNDKMYEYHKKRKLKGYDALIRIVTK
ncbi:hypothetical protein OB69_03840 [Roseivirga seohaensis subsp. aquiponti]|uniref:Peptidase M56 domain-containing protein n=1 Tax=Roseivirga seohaensis subsp. aquiponti TaxID=1566026 RepID=A0A0L8ANU0_9BACT|nr:M56 family metallopeptidase [Roseivirga seohaensis]KOF04123.1 hypothetical protein OB69_03840 [Roseivirga seohaensis subsp. aquiponti]